MVRTFELTLKRSFRLVFHRSSMSQRSSITFSKAAPSEGDSTLVVFCDETLALAPGAVALGIGDLVARAAKTASFSGKAFATLDILAPADLAAARLLIVGLGKPSSLVALDWSRLGGVIAGVLRNGERAVLLAERPDDEPLTPADLAEIGFGMVLRSYRFDRYKSRAKGEGEKGGGEKGDAKAPPTLVIVHPEAGKAKKAFADRAALAEGVLLARDLVNEPANSLGTEELADKAAALAELGVTIEVLTEKQMKKLGMRALLGVAQGSVRPPRLVVMRWNGAEDKDAKPIALVGKGVVFDSGGISIKPAGGMEDMKGDMGGAAAVIGLMHALAARKAKANVVGVVGIVENMPDANAQRPGDIVEAASGTTIEIINTDAEGRLVLADALWFVQKFHEPRLIIDLATLTGAIIVALGHDHAGLFSNDDALAGQLLAAGLATGEKLWRMPLGEAYDKQIESKFADIKNTGGREAGSVTAAQFLQRFINSGMPWAHLDIAGTAMGSPQSETNRAWASGWGVRLLDRFIAETGEG